MDLDPKQRRNLRAQAHQLHPVVSIGQHGLTPRVLHEIDVALTAHGLIKIRVHSDDRAAREAMLADIAEHLHAAPVQHLGKLLLVWRPRDEDDAQRERESMPTVAKHAPAARKSPAQERRAAKSSNVDVPTPARRRRRSVNEAIGARALAEVRRQSADSVQAKPTSRKSAASAVRNRPKATSATRPVGASPRRRRTG